MRIEKEDDHRSNKESSVAPASEIVPQAADRLGTESLSQPDASVSIEMLVSQYHADLFRYAYRLSGRVEDAEDITQQAFLIAQRKIAQLREIDRARGWLFAIVRNCFLKDVRKKQPSLAEDGGFDIEGVESLVAHQAEITSEELQIALDQLSNEQRMIVTAYYFEHASYKEIASAFAIPLGTVMSRLSRAKSALRQLLLDRRDLTSKKTTSK